MARVTYDVVVVGFGAAGACAAIEAARAGARVLICDRFYGGGATALSGGVIYAGGGTTTQRAAGVTDTPDAMFAYLSREVGDAVTPATLRRFCDESPAMIDWLASLGVPFQGSLCPYKTSYPSNRHYLYQSGSESSFGDTAARGHRTHGRGTSGKVLMKHLARAQRADVRTGTAVTDLIITDGRVTGVRARTVTRHRAAHRLLSRYAAKPGLYVPAIRRTLRKWIERIERAAETVEIRANAVVIASGGFVANRTMFREHTSQHHGGLPLGTLGDDGSGIGLGVAAGGATRLLDRVSVWRFISPPSALLGGVLVDRAGARIIDESRYGAAIGDALVGRPGWLLIDDAVRTEARAQLRTQTVWFQRWQTRYLLRTAVRGNTVTEVASKAGIDPAGLDATLGAYHADGPDPTGKPDAFRRRLATPPYHLLDISIRPSVAYPCPMLTLGGLVVHEDTGQVRRPDGSTIDGLYAAGRTAVGICSNSYVSGLSLADCVFAGRRAGRAAAAVSQEGSWNAQLG